MSYFLKLSPQWFNIINCHHSLQIKMYWALLFHCGAKLNTSTHMYTNTHMFWGHTPKKSIPARTIILLYYLLGMILLETRLKTVSLASCPPPSRFCGMIWALHIITNNSYHVSLIFNVPRTVLSALHIPFNIFHTIVL